MTSIVRYEASPATLPDGGQRAPLCDNKGNTVVALASTTAPGLLTTSDLTGLRINVSASGVTELVAAVSAQTTRVHRMKLSVAGAVIVQIRDGATVLEVFNFSGVGGGIVLDFDQRPWYKTTANTALNINLSAAVQVDGRIEYVTSA